MTDPILHRLDAMLGAILDGVHALGRHDLSAEAERGEACRESLEAFRALTRYRGLLKNVAEINAAEYEMA